MRLGSSFPTSLELIAHRYYLARNGEITSCWRMGPMHFNISDLLEPTMLSRLKHHLCQIEGNGMKESCNSGFAAD